MALLEGPPVIAEDLLEGVFVDPLSVVCHGRWLYHTLPPGFTCLPSLPCGPPWSLERGDQGQHKKEILIRSSYQRPRLPLPLIPLVDTKFRENGSQPSPNRACTFPRTRLSILSSCSRGL